jgi:hypothetical protein
MREAFSDFAWEVAPEYDWAERHDARGEPLIHAESIRLYEVFDGWNQRLDQPDALRSCGSVETAWQRYELEGSGSGPILVPVEGQTKTYRPMQRAHAGLFLAFSQLDYRNKEAIRGFAKVHGLLRRPAHDHYGEPHLTWAREICLIREAVKTTMRRTPAQDAADRTAWQRVGMEPPHEQRRRRKASLFDMHLQHLQARMMFEPNEPPHLSYWPQNLLAAMWLQLALALAEGKEFVECKNCQRIFEISTDEMGFRSHREFCSGSCKTKDYRRRKRDALRLSASGTRLRDISDKTGTPEATVRAWLASAKRREETAKPGRN